MSLVNFNDYSHIKLPSSNQLRTQKLYPKTSFNRNLVINPSEDIISFASRSIKTDKLNKLESGLLAPASRPVILIHGLLTDASSMENYANVLSNAGITVNSTNYETIKKQEGIAESASIVSANINKVRAQKTKILLEQLKLIKNDNLALEQFFSINDEITEQNKTILTSLIRNTINSVEMVLQRSNINENFSSKINEIEVNLTNKIKKMGLVNEEKDCKDYDLFCSKISATIINSIVPKISIIGHSMGSLVAYTVILNPDKYDGGYGIASILLLSGAPNGKKLSALESLTGRGWDKQEKVGNPLEITRETALSAARMIFPFIEEYLIKPYAGLVDAYKDSTFYKNNIKDKTLPPDVSVISAYNINDLIVLPEDSRFDQTLPQHHNLELSIPSSNDEDNKKKTINSNIHYQTAYKPEVIAKALYQKIVRDPDYATKILYTNNYDGFRSSCLNILQAEEEKYPGFLQDYNLIRQLQKVAKEDSPFANSPSSIAKQLLIKVQNKSINQ